MRSDMKLLYAGMDEGQDTQTKVEICWNLQKTIPTKDDIALLKMEG